MFKDKTLLITGGTGSFGNAVLRRFADSDLREIRIFSRDEKKQDDMRKRYKNPKIQFYIGDVRDDDIGYGCGARSGFHFPCRRAQAGAVMRVSPDAGGQDQCDRHR